MNYTQHPSNNAVFGAPKGWDQAELPVGALPVTIHPAGMTSFWQPEPEELAALNKGAAVMLTIVGSAHPIVSVGVEAA